MARKQLGAATSGSTDAATKSYVDGYAQPLDPDLTTIAGLTATSDNFMQAKSGAWASRTPAQVAADLQVEIGKLMYPVGSIYISINSTNPATSLGFGTWSAFGAGRVPVGFDSGDANFDADEETGGAKTVATNVAVATQPTFSVDSHTHALSDLGFACVTLAASATNTFKTRRLTSPAWTPTHAQSSAAAGTFTTSETTGVALRGATDGGTAGATRTADVALTNNATSVVQPYITVRMWKRTA